GQELPARPHPPVLRSAVRLPILCDPRTPKARTGLVMSTPSWKEQLAGRISDQMTGEIEHFENQIALRKAGKIEEKVFAETRLRRLASVGITTREACGNSVRNGTACPIAGVCKTETFDVTPYAKAIAFYLLGHRDTQDFGRKFKIAFSGCEHEACALVSIHDLGGIAKVRSGPDGKPQRGFAIYVGGGLGAVPHQAKLYEEFVPEHELLPLARAIGRVFARMGEKRNRNRPR